MWVEDAAIEVGSLSLSPSQVPTGERLVFGDQTFDKYEAEGVKEGRNAAFVLVAGGLGERLGYSGIKVTSLPLCKQGRHGVLRGTDSSWFWGGARSLCPAKPPPPSPSCSCT